MNYAALRMFRQYAAAMTDNFNQVAADLEPEPTFKPLPKVGDLAIFTDHAGRKIGCKVLQIFGPGQVSSGEMIKVRVCGLSAQGPYPIGMTLTVDADKVQRAI